MAEKIAVRLLDDLKPEERKQLVKTVEELAEDGRLKVIDKVDILKVCVRATERKAEELKLMITPDGRPQ